MMTRLVIVGAGGFGREVADVVDAINSSALGADRLELLGFVDDGQPDLGLIKRRGVTYLGAVAVLQEMTLDVEYVIAIGDGAARKRIDETLRAQGRRAASLVHPGSIVGFDVRIGPGVLICAGAV